MTDKKELNALTVAVIGGDQAAEFSAALAECLCANGYRELLREEKPVFKVEIPAPVAPPLPEPQKPYPKIVRQMGQERGRPQGRRRPYTFGS